MLCTPVSCLETYICSLPIIAFQNRPGHVTPSHKSVLMLCYANKHTVHTLYSNVIMYLVLYQGLAIICILLCGYLGVLS